MDEGDLLAEARSFLHNYQAEAISHALGTSDRDDLRLMVRDYSPWYGQDLSAVTLDYFDEYSAVETVPGVPGRVRRGPFTYDPQIETLRTAQGRALVERSQPGPFEHPRYLALLARQAGSIELAETAINGVPDELFRRVILGCAPDPDVDSRTRALEADRAAVVIANTGLVDFVFRSAKPVIRAMQPEAKGGGGVSITHDLERTEKFIEATKDDPEGPVRQFQLLIAQHLYGNVSEGGNPAEAIEHPPLSVLTSIAERFVLAHEYGHCFVRPDWWDPNSLPPNIKEVYRDPKFAEEAIDSHATITTIWSAAVHDHFEPPEALAAVIFSLRCFEIHTRAIKMATTGSLQDVEPESDTHPPTSERASTAIDTFKRYFDIAFDDLTGRVIDFSYVRRPVTPPDHPFTDAHRAECLVYAKVLAMLWTQVREWVLAQHREGRPVHPRWQTGALL